MNTIPDGIENSEERAAFTLKNQYRIREEKALSLIQRSVSELTVDKYKQMLKTDKVENEEESKKIAPASADNFNAPLFQGQVREEGRHFGYPRPAPAQLRRPCRRWQRSIIFSTFVSTAAPFMR